MIKVGQIRQEHDEDWIYTVTYKTPEYDEWHIITNYGCVLRCGSNSLEKDTLIAEYPTWQEAVNSKEFNR